MRRLTYCLLFCLTSTLATSVFGEDAKSTPPNIVFIMADDLGYGELGCYGQKYIKTPFIDQIAKGGMRFTQHYSGSPVCAPARCTLMTGKHGGHAYIRDNAQPKDRKNNPAKLEFAGQLPIPAEEITVAELFKDQGYATAATGKWGLGWEGSTGDPNKQGFDLFFGFLCQYHAHNHYPRFLWKNGEKILYEGNDRTLKGEVYSQDKFVDEAVGFIEEHKDEPFFVYCPFAVPHLSIQVPDADVEAYRETIPEEDHEHRGYLKHPFPRAGYAGMVTHMDAGVGRILKTLDELGLTDNTIVVFTSDNGPTYNRLGGSDSEFFNSAHDFRGLKGSIYEGGIRVPMVIRWPGKIKADTVCDLPTYFPDWLPTLLDLAGHKDAVPDVVDGESFAPALLGKDQTERGPMIWEFHGYTGQQAVRLGDYKGLRRNLAKGNLELELYDLKNDPSETTDIAADHPDMVAKMKKILAEEHTTSPAMGLKALGD